MVIIIKRLRYLAYLSFVLFSMLDFASFLDANDIVKHFS